jgi:hypothetical protein
MKSRARIIRDGYQASRTPWTKKLPQRCYALRQYLLNIPM